MNTQTFSRSFLQGIPEQRKQEKIDYLINRFVRYLQDDAAEGKTSYMYVYNQIDKNSGLQMMVPLGITDEELVSAFSKRFPDCAVSYQEKWVDVARDNRVLKKGIVIDWS